MPKVFKRTVMPKLSRWMRALCGIKPYQPPARSMSPLSPVDFFGSVHSDQICAECKTAICQPDGVNTSEHIFMRHKLPVPPWYSFLRYGFMCQLGIDYICPACAKNGSRWDAWGYIRSKHNLVIDLCKNTAEISDQPF